MSITLTAARRGDAAALTLSTLCLVHCLALPVVAVALPILGAFAEAEWVHWIFAGLAAPISLWTLRRSGAGLLTLAAAGVVLLFAGAAEFPTHEAETVVTVTGGLLISAAHILNLRRRHS
jgi:hypothetical protein